MVNHYYLKAEHTYFICPTLGKLGAFEFLEATDRKIASFYDLLKILPLKSLL